MLAFVGVCAVFLAFPVAQLSTLGGLTFWFVLITPFCILQFFAAPDTHERSESLFAAIPAVWYCIIFILFHIARTEIAPPILCKVGTVLGTTLVFYVLATARLSRWTYIMIAPHGFAAVSGTIWIVLTT